MLAQGALVQAALVAIPGGTAVAPTFINGWFMPLSTPTVRILPGLTPPQQMFLSTVPLFATVPFGWFEPLIDPIRFPPALRTGLQQFLAPSPNPYVTFSWMEALSEPSVKTKPGLRPASQMVLVYHPSPIINISWWRPLAEPVIKTKLGLRASQQQFLAQPPRLLPTPTITGTLSAVEAGDSALFAGLSFARPTTAMIGVIELAKVPYVGIIETRASQGVSGVVESARAPASGSPVTAIASAAVGIRII